MGGDIIAKGYFEMPEETSKEFYEENGKQWFKTGDIAQVMPNGTFRIIDRKKDLIKLQMGEYVSLGKVESVLKIHNLLETICVIAKPSKSYTIAIIVPKHSALMELALVTKNDYSGMNFEELCIDERIKEEVLKSITSHGLSLGLEKFEIPKKIYLTTEPWTPDSGLVTSAMKLKRKEIDNHFGTQIHQMYSNM